MKKTFPTYEEAQKMVSKEKVKTAIDYSHAFKRLGLPSNPRRVYKNEGWTNWYDFLGGIKVSLHTYEEAQKIVKENGIKSQREYNLVYKRLGLPGCPSVYYRDKGWTNWYDFTGRRGRSILNYNEAQRIVQQNGIKSATKYWACCKDLGLPSMPCVTYKNKGWVDWYDFFGKTKTVPKCDRKYNILKRLAITPALLKDDAPLQVIYIFVSQFNKELAKEIEVLLGTSSYEERLNWVKEQLKGLKDGSSSKAKSSDETSIDGLEALESSVDEYEYSSDEVLLEDFLEEKLEEETDELTAIESIVEENKDVIDSLSEEKLERLNIIYENYVHSVVNRELIAEYDG